MAGTAYAITVSDQSKIANALFAVDLDTIGEPDGIRAFSVHPGGVITDFIRYVTQEEVRAYGVLDTADRSSTSPQHEDA